MSDDVVSGITFLVVAAALLFGGCGFIVGRVTKGVSVDISIQRDEAKP